MINCFVLQTSLCIGLRVFCSLNGVFLFPRGFFVPGRVFSVPGVFSVPSSWVFSVPPFREEKTPREGKTPFREGKTPNPSAFLPSFTFHRGRVDYCGTCKHNDDGQDPADHGPSATIRALGASPVSVRWAIATRNSLAISTTSSGHSTWKKGSGVTAN